jgi:hypothetical protein
MSEGIDSPVSYSIRPALRGGSSCASRARARLRARHCEARHDVVSSPSTPGDSRLITPETTPPSIIANPAMGSGRIRLDTFILQAHAACDLKRHLKTSRHQFKDILRRGEAPA